MDSQDFAMPSPKRQRTESPKPALEPTHIVTDVHQPDVPQTTALPEAEDKISMNEVQNTTTRGLEVSVAQAEVQPTTLQDITPAGNDILDTLMLHVESISRPEAAEALPTHTIETVASVATIQKEIVPVVGKTTTQNEHIQMDNGADVASHVQQLSEQQQPPQPDDFPQMPALANSENTAAATEPSIQEEAIVSNVAADQDQVMGEERQEANGDTTVNTEGAEWEVDSSPYISSDSDDSSDTTSDDSDDDDVDGDYAMLDPEEQARILMAGDGGSDDEGDKKGKAEGGHLRTANEKIEEVIPKPDIVVSEDMNIEELGTVEGVVEKTVLVKAKISGEYQVLESNSLLCLHDRCVVGVVAEPLGRVEQPMYTIRFTNDDAIKEAGLSEKGTKVFYVPQHSSFVFTQPLKAVKGSDASNFHDEEVGDEEMEFSDDEQEAEHKRALKMKRQGRRDDQGSGRGRGRGSRGNYQRGGRQEYRAPSSDSGSIYGNGPAEINYDDIPEGADEGYTPLARPANLNEMMAGVQREPMEGSHFVPNYTDQGMGRGRGRGRGRGDRDRRHGRGGRGGGGTQPSWTTHQNVPPAQSNGYTQHSPQSMPPPPQYSQQWQQQPYQPHLSPQIPQSPFSPSPISPLPANQFNFNFQQQSQQRPGVQQYGTPQFGQQLGQQQMHPSTSGWNPTAAAAQVAAQLEQLRRSHGRQ